MDNKYNKLERYLTLKNSFTKNELKKIISKFKHVKTKKNEIICSLKEVCEHFYFINSGCLRLHQIDSKGKDITGYFALEDSFITSVTSFTINIPSRDILTSQIDCDLLVINRNDFFQLTEKIPEFNKIYQQFMLFALTHSQMRIYSFLGMNAEDKIKWAMEHEPKLFTNISDKAIATYLGMTRSTLCKLLAKLK